jgi:diacylglycerol kinase (ATP)
MKIRAIINPVSGLDKMRSMTVEIAHRLKTQFALDDRDFYYTTRDNEGLSKSFVSYCDMLVVAGGDGTLHYVINKLKRYGLNIPIAYLPSGTTNDFGKNLALPRDTDTFCNMLNKHDIQYVDLGLAGNRYFHYVVAGGAMSSVSYTTNQKLKNKLGHSAYYFSVIPQLGNMLKGTGIKIESDEIQTEEEALLYFVAHSPLIGGLSQLIPGAKFNDGMLHVLVIKKTNPLAAASLYRDILHGTHIRRPDVLYFQTKRVCIKPFNALTARVGIDGELFDGAPRSIEVIPGGQSILVPKRQLAAA